MPLAMDASSSSYDAEIVRAMEAMICGIFGNGSPSQRSVDSHHEANTVEADCTKAVRRKQAPTQGPTVTSSCPHLIKLPSLWRVTSCLLEEDGLYAHLLAAGFQVHRELDHLG